MVFYIDYSIHDVLNTRKLSEEEAIFFADLSNMYRKGACYLCGNINSLDILSQQLGNPSDNIYRSVKKCYAESGAVMRAVQTIIVLTFLESPSIDDLPEILQVQNKAIFIPISVAQKWSPNKKCCLLAENLNDCTFYERIAAYYCLKHGIKGIQICFHHENGGGNTICDVLRKCVQKEKEFTLCIIDSDKKHGVSDEYPNEPARGDTFCRASRVSTELLKDTDLPPHALKPLDVHEVENLIPQQVLEQIQKELPAMDRGLDLLEKLRKIECGSPILYYDFKMGFPLIKDEPKRSYWKKILFALGGTEADVPPVNRPKNDRVDPYKLFFPPLSNNNLLTRANLFLNDTTLPTLHLDTYLLPYWEQIGELMLTWGCAGLPIYA